MQGWILTNNPDWKRKIEERINDFTDGITGFPRMMVNGVSRDLVWETSPGTFLSLIHI